MDGPFETPPLKWRVGLRCRYGSRVLHEALLLRVNREGLSPQFYPAFHVDYVTGSRRVTPRAR